MSVTLEQISKLQDEAGAAGDDEQVKICEGALWLGERSWQWRECERVIVEASGEKR